MSYRYQPLFLRGPRMAVYLVLAVAGGCVVAQPYLSETHGRLVQAQAPGLPLDRIDAGTVEFVSGGP